METKNLSYMAIIGVTMGFTALAIGTGWYWVAHIKTQGEAIVGSLVKESSLLEKEAVVQRLREEDRSSMALRQNMRAHIIFPEKIPNFLGLLESISVDTPLKVVAVERNTATRTLIVSCSYTGELDAIQDVLERITHIPYALTVDAVHLSRDSDAVWVADFNLHVVIGPEDAL